MSNEKHITIDGNTAAASMAYMLSDTAFIYPITPSSPMAENIDAWGVKGKKNIYVLWDEEYYLTRDRTPL
jgi:pyruvate-ferredoxin/flavodoxin oxidoreductase